MLAYILAIAVGLGSLALYTAALFFPELYRKGDLIWSGIGLFYALILWVCAGQLRGGLLLGQIAGVALVGWLGWQTLTLRRELTPAAQKTKVSENLPAKLVESIAQLPQRVAGLLKPKTSKSAQVATAPTIATTEPLVEAPSPTPATPEEQLEEAVAAESTPAPEVPTPPVSSTQAVESEGEETIVTPSPAPAKAKAEKPSSSGPKSKTFAKLGGLVSAVKNLLPKKTKSQPVAKPASTVPPATTVDEDFDFEMDEETTPAESVSPSLDETPSAAPAISVAEIAPDAELAPPAEPVGSGSPEDRAEQEQSPLEAPVAMEAVPVETPTPSSEEQAEIDSQLHRPNPPDPELVEAAKNEEDEQAKGADSPEDKS